MFKKFIVYTGRDGQLKDTNGQMFRTLKFSGPKRRKPKNKRSLKFTIEICYNFYKLFNVRFVDSNNKFNKISFCFLSGNMHNDICKSFPTWITFSMENLVKMDIFLHFIIIRLQMNGKV